MGLTLGLVQGVVGKTPDHAHTNISRTVTPIFLRKQGRRQADSIVLEDRISL
jgi:hypothetical protein